MRLNSKGEKMREIILVSFVLFLLFQIVYIFISALFLKPEKKVEFLKKEKGISILVPAYNEELTIKNCILANKLISYENYETIIINDGSRDNTLNLLKGFLDLEEKKILSNERLKHKKIIKIYKSKNYKNIIVIDKENGGKADALNCGINYSSKDYIVTIDADSMIKKDSLHYLNEAFEDRNILAIGGTVHISQGVGVKDGEVKGKFSKLPNMIKFQILQYLNSFYVRKFTQSKLGGILVIAGAFGAFKKDILFDINGYRNTVGEDIDITLKIQNLIKKKFKKGKIIYKPEVACYTECPQDFKSLFVQRFRWQKAFVDCLVLYWDGFLNNFKLPVSLFFLLDSLFIGSLSSVFNFIFFYQILIGRFSFVFLIKTLLIAFFITFTQNIIAIYKGYKCGFEYEKRDFLSILLFLPLDIFIYRQLGNIFVLGGTLEYFWGKKKWGSPKRIGKAGIV